MPGIEPGTTGIKASCVNHHTRLVQSFSASNRNLRMVRGEGFEPPKPEGVWFTARCSYPYLPSTVVRERVSPLSRCLTRFVSCSRPRLVCGAWLPPSPTIRPGVKSPDRDPRSPSFCRAQGIRTLTRLFWRQSDTTYAVPYVVLNLRLHAGERRLAVAWLGSGVLPF